ncbi:uncharacterized protein LOC116248779 isoform X2 [Nymphaea colorata]|uniref:uncharacterized protein LOC116248779 isoform X2 n=1 Tax=Nymphaea colorata TaxID=210225 RepID=UPI00129ED003|nr:uncharacterized protein LOC116248779 isoform X2 [Nymphaea colorata]
MSVTMLSSTFSSPQPAIVCISPSSPSPSKPVNSTLPSSSLSKTKTVKLRKFFHSPLQALRSPVSSFTYVSNMKISSSLQTQMLNAQLSQFGKKWSVFSSGILPLKRRYGEACVRCSPLGDGDKQETSLEGENNLRKDGDGGDWTTSVLLFVFWAGVMYYVFQLAPDQTPFQVQYCLTIPTLNCSSRSRVAVWPFVLLSFFGGAYALIPYFVLWKPPLPTVDEAELKKWPLSFLESKITAGVVAAAGFCLVAYAVMSSGEDWREFYQYFRESKFIHAMSLDFSLFTAFSPFWIYNDMTARRWYSRGSWLLPLSLVPFLGPLLYLVLRPSPSLPATAASTATEDR